MATTLVVFCANQNVHLEFLNQKELRFRLHCAMGLIDTMGTRVTSTMAKAWRAKHEFKATTPYSRNYVPAGPSVLITEIYNLFNFKKRPYLGDVILVYTASMKPKQKVNKKSEKTR